MTNNQNKKQQNTAQQILKKIQQQSSQQKKQKTLQILNRSKTTADLQTKPKINYFQFAKTWYETNSTKLYKYLGRDYVQKTIYMTTFLLFSTVVCWKIQSKFDYMKKKASTTKTFKQAQIQQQNIRINKFLANNKFQPVPIKNQPQYKNTYKYQQENAFDTRDTLLQALAKEYRQGGQIDPMLLGELKDKGFI